MIKKIFDHSWDTKNTVLGFTLIELIVVVGIIAMISSVSFWSGRAFNNKTLVSSVAQDVSLVIRQAQNYGAFGKETSSGSGVFTSGYGVYISSASPTSIVLYVDSNLNNKYDGSSSCDGECLEKTNLRNGVSVVSANGVCATNYSNGTSCGTSLHLTFLRPNQNAAITLLDASGVVVSGGPWASGRITLQAPGGGVTKNISVNQIGQVFVQ